MEFITVEQFREQPIEVQEAFLDWWKNERVKTYTYSNYPTCLMITDKNYDAIKNASGGIIPLLSEGELRNFIEDKTGIEIEILKSSSVRKCVGTMFYDRKEMGNEPKYKVDEIDLLKAYWKVACILAKEEIDG